MNSSHLIIPIEVFFKTAPKENLALIKEELHKIHTILQETPLLQVLINNCSLTKNQLFVLWEQVLKALDIQHFLKNYILALGKLGFLKDSSLIIEKILKEMNQEDIDIFVTSAFPLSPQDYAELIHHLKKEISFFKEKNFQWHRVIDPQLLGGYTVAVGPYWLDLSVKTQLKKLEHQVKE